MGFRLLRVFPANQIFKRIHMIAQASDVPKGHFAIYVGDTKKRRFIVPIAYLNHRSFQNLLRQAEEEFGFHHPMGGLTIPCREEVYLSILTAYES